MKLIVLDGEIINPDNNPWILIEAFGDLVVYDNVKEDAVVELSEDKDIIITNNTPITKDIIAQLPNLKYICVLATGFNNVDIEAAAKHNIPVSNVSDYAVSAVAQHVFSLLLGLTNKSYLHSDNVKNGGWSRNGQARFWLEPLVELKGLTIGIIGYGKIGTRVSEIAHAFGMDIIAYNPHPKQAPQHIPVAWVALEELFSKVDVVSLHCKQTKQNERFVNQRLLRTMKSSAFFINTARGGLVNEDDLAAVLCEGKIAGAGLDVVSVEPIRVNNPLLRAPNCIITPHHAANTLGCRRRLMESAARNIQAFISGNPINVVNRVRGVL